MSRKHLSNYIVALLAIYRHRLVQQSHTKCQIHQIASEAKVASESFLAKWSPSAHMDPLGREKKQHRESRLTVSVSFCIRRWAGLRKIFLPASRWNVVRVRLAITLAASLGLALVFAFPLLSPFLRLAVTFVPFPRLFNSPCQFGLRFPLPCNAIGLVKNCSLSWAHSITSCSVLLRSRDSLKALLTVSRRSSNSKFNMTTQGGRRACCSIFSPLLCETGICIRYTRSPRSQFV